MVDGVATATEVSTIGIIYTIIVGMVIYRQFDWRGSYPILVETASLSGAILLVVGAATAMAWALTQSGFSHAARGDAGRGAGREGRVPAGVGAGVHRAGQRAGGGARDRAVRAAAVSDCGRDGRQRDPLRDGGGVRDGFRPVHAAIRRGVLSGLRHRPGLAGCGDPLGLAASGRAVRRLWC